MNSHIAVTDNFNSIHIDHDIIVPDKVYFNIYNNSLDEPFHKFWFYVENAKFINSYSDNNVFRFAFNNKNEKIKKVFTYIKNIFEHMKSLFQKIYPDIVIDMPWKEYENYPYFLNFFLSENCLVLDKENNNKKITELNKEQNCSILFELTYIQLVKTKLDNFTNYSLKFKFSLIMIQEKNIDIKNSLLESINNLNNKNNINNQNNVNNVNAINNNLNFTVNASSNLQLDKSKNTQSNYMSPMRMLALDPSVLLNKKNTLNKINKDNKETQSDESKDVPEYLEQKNKLKKVETDEKSLIPILKKEFEESNNNNIEIEKTYNDKNNLDEPKNITIKKKNKNKKSTSNKIKKNVLSDDAYNDLELEFEKMLKS